MDGITLQKFIDRVAHADVLDGDISVRQTSDGGYTLAKVNFGSWLARKLFGGDRTLTTTAKQNEVVRKTFLAAIGKRFAKDSPTYKAAERMLGLGAGDSTAFKPLSRREIKRVLVSLKLYQDDAAGGFRPVGGDVGLALTKKQFAGMVDQTRILAEKMIVSEEDFAALKKVETEWILHFTNNNGEHDRSLDRLDVRHYDETVALLRRIVANSALPKAAKLMEMPPLPIGNVDIHSEAFRKQMRKTTAFVHQIIDAIRAEALTKGQYAALKEQVEQLKSAYDQGRTIGDVAPLLAEGLDLRSVAATLIGRVREGRFTMPEQRDQVRSGYASHRIHSSSASSCANLESLRTFEEMHGESKLAGLLSFGEDADLDPLGKPSAENAFIADLILNDDPLEVENSQLKGGERIGRAFFRHYETFAQLCNAVGNRKRDVVTFNSALRRFGSIMSEADKTALVDLVDKINRECFSVKSGKQTVFVGASKTKFYGSSQKVFKIIADAKAEELFTGALGRQRASLANNVLAEFGLDREDGLQPKELMLREFVLRLFEKADDVTLRGLVASGYRHAAENAIGFDCAAVLLGAGPVIQKLLQGLDASRAKTDEAKRVLGAVLDSTPYIPERLVKAELLNIVRQSTNRNGAVPIKSINVSSVLGSASIGQVFKCEVGFDDGKGGVDKRTCVIKMMRPNVRHLFEKEALEFRNLVEELKVVHVGERKFADIDAVFTDYIQSVRRELSFRDELRNVIRGLRTYGADGADVQSLMPLLKNPNDREIFLAEIKYGQLTDDQLIDLYCVPTDGDSFVLAFVDGQNLEKFSAGMLKAYDARTEEGAENVRKLKDGALGSQNFGDDVAKARGKGKGEPINQMPLKADPRLHGFTFDPKDAKVVKYILGHLDRFEDGETVLKGEDDEEARLWLQRKVDEIKAELEVRAEKVEEKKKERTRLLEERDEFMKSTETLRTNYRQSRAFKDVMRHFVNCLKGYDEKALVDGCIYCPEDGSGGQTEDRFQVAWQEFAKQPNAREIVDEFYSDLRAKPRDPMGAFRNDFRRALVKDKFRHVKAMLSENGARVAEEAYAIPRQKLDEMNEAIAAVQKEIDDAFSLIVEVDNAENEQIAFEANRPEGGEPVYMTDKDVVETHLENLKNGIRSAINGIKTGWSPVCEVHRKLMAVVKKIVDGVKNGKPPFLHGDSHAGNIMYTKTELAEFLTLIDYGKGMTLSEQEARAFVEILHELSAKEISAEKVVDAYRRIIDARLEGSNDPAVAGQAADPNELAEYRLLKQTAGALKDENTRTSLIRALRDALKSGGDVATGLDKLVDVLGKRKLMLPPSIVNFRDSQIKLQNSENELKKTSEVFQSFALDVSRKTAVKYLNAMLDDLKSLNGPAPAGGNPEPLFKSGFFNEHGITEDTLDPNVVGKELASLKTLREQLSISLVNVQTVKVGSPLSALEGRQDDGYDENFHAKVYLDMFADDDQDDPSEEVKDMPPAFVTEKDIKDRSDLLRLQIDRLSEYIEVFEKVADEIRSADDVQKAGDQARLLPTAKSLATEFNNEMSLDMGGKLLGDSNAVIAATVTEAQFVG